MKSIDLVREFHVKHGAPVNETPGIDPARVRLRLDLIAEEFKELCEACGYKAEVSLRCRFNGVNLAPADIVEAADALGDIRWVVEGAALEWGVPLDAVTEEIARSNATKDVGEKRGDGKIRKGASYSPPDITSVLWPEGRK